MNSFVINYIIRSGISVGLLYLFFVAFLDKEKMHKFNRFYLLASLIFSFVVPLLTLPVLIPSTSIISVLDFPDFTDNNLQSQAITLPQSGQLNIGLALWSFYFIISSVLLIRFFSNLVRLEIMRLRKPSIKYEGYKIVLIDEPVLPYSFLSTIYVNSVEYREGRIPGELLSHEISHITQRHSFDIIFIELLKIFFWFNPLLYLFKKSIMLNHEYLADEEVTKSQSNSQSYIDILLHIAFRNNKSYLASSFNYSFTKKRLLMMTKNNFSKMAILKKIAVIPLFLSLGLLVINAQETKTIKSTGTTPPPPGFFDFKSQTGKPPLIYIDGVISNTDLSKIDLTTMEGVVVYKDETAVKKFGEKGKDGVIEFSTRKKDSEIPKDRTIYAELRSTPLDPDAAKRPFVMVEEMPEFPGGGDNAMRSWISQNLKYPQEALKQKIEGTVTVRFYIDTKGKPQEIMVTKTDNTILNAEAIRVVGNMPDWKPGKQGGKLVEVYKMVPIVFKVK
jgi:TonB family protein